MHSRCGIEMQCLRRILRTNCTKHIMKVRIALCKIWKYKLSLLGHIIRVLKEF